jgi:hypothetical protein
MIHTEDKQHIYELLLQKFEPEKKIPLASVSFWLTRNGLSCRQYGYTRMKPLLLELTEFVTLQEETTGTRHPKQEVILHIWDKKAAGGAPQKGEANAAPTFAEQVNIPAKTLSGYAALAGCDREAALAEIAEAYRQAVQDGTLKEEDGARSFPAPHAQILLQENLYKNTDGKAWHLVLRAKNDPEILSEEEPPAAAPVQSGPLTEEDRREIYLSLCAVFPTGEKLHMARVSQVLSESGYTKERYGFSKMKEFFKTLTDFLILDDVMMSGVPQTLITIRPMPAWSVGKPDREKTTDAAGAALPLPEALDETVTLLPKALARLNQEITGVEAPPPREVLDDLRESYRAARRTGEFRRRGDAYIFSLNRTSQNGDAMIASIKESPYGDNTWCLNFAGTDRQTRTNPGKMLEQFAVLGPWQSFLEELASKALPEKWDFEHSKRRNYFILQKYIQYTFYRLQLEDKVCISDDRTFAAFNTGLVTPYYDDLYACFEAQMNAESQKTGWRFIEFCTAAGRGVGKRLVDCFNPLPQPASYFERREDLLFDLEKELHTDYEHILLDNISRLPLDFVREECRGAQEAQELIDRIEAASDWRERKRRYAELSRLIASVPRLFNRMRNRLEDAIELARKQVRWNFKTAIPCYFPTRNVMSLMLPLALQNDNRPDAALVVELTHSGNYQGQTILNLQQAYLDGRLLCRPNSEWLDSREIPGEEVELEEE